MNGTIFPRIPPGTWSEAWEADAQPACKLVVDIPVTNEFIICLDMLHDHPGKFYDFIKCFYNLILMNLLAVTCD